VRIACIDNISAAAYRLLRPDFPVVWLNGPPVHTAHAISRGLCDAALVPVADLPRLASIVRPAGPFGIAATGPVRSVLYLGQRTPERLIERGEFVHISAESRTTRALFPALCRVSYGAPPHITSDVSRAAARVVIGNDAMRLSRVLPRFAVTLDLGEWWHAETQLPFVFALWVVRRTLPSRERRAVRTWLELTTAPSETPEGRAVMAREVRELGIAHDSAVEYYRGIEYRLSEEHRLGLTAFLNLQEEEATCTANG
jgi:chorismate dehydratase